MKKIRLGLAIFVLRVLIWPLVAYSQGTGFTYNGRLNNNGAPVNGSYDMRFTLYDSSAGNNVIAGPLTISTVDVASGLFAVKIDFGPGVFTGPARWLNVEVQPTGGGGFAALTPRQEVTSSPYSIQALTAGSVIDGGVAANQLNTGGVAPTPGQILSFNGGNLFWTDPGVAAGNIWSLAGNNAFYNAGNVGIGTSTPQEKLTLAGVTSYNTGLKLTGNATGGTGLALENTSSGGHKFDLLSGGSGDGIGVGAFGIFDETANSYRLSVSSGGNIGIGTATPASKLTVRTGNSTFTGYGFEHTDGTVRLSTFIDTGYGAWLGTRSNHALNFFVNDGLPSMSIDTSGDVVMTPNGGSGGYGSTYFGTPNGESGMSIKGNNRADMRFNGTTLKLVAGLGGGPPPSENGITVNTAGNIGMGTDTPLAKLDVRGTTRTSVLTITGGSDLAEPFLMNGDDAQRGSVMVIDGEHPGRLKISNRAYDQHVAGIVSGANGINPGISLQQEGVLEGGQNVALSGRVYVLADATHGGIKPGDLLTTSDTPGHAMKAVNHVKAQGAILGKAMSSLSSGKGMVLVLVTLQ